MTWTASRSQTRWPTNSRGHGIALVARGLKHEEEDRERDGSGKCENRGPSCVFIIWQYGEKETTGKEEAQ